MLAKFHRTGLVFVVILEKGILSYSKINTVCIQVVKYADIFETLISHQFAT